jgi:preprotein translocase subunit YajC
MLINTAFADEDTITVQGTEEQLPQAPDTTQSMLTSMIPMVLIFVVFYFFLIRPQEKRRRQQEDLVGSVKRGEQVVTSSGIYGTVTRINDNDNTVELEIAKDIQIKLLKSAIVDIVSRKNTEIKADKIKADK